MASDQKNSKMFQIEDDWFGFIIGLAILLVIILLT